jgi:hypothetical protein
MSRKGDYKIPFGRDGHPQSYPEGWYEGEWPNGKRVGPEWRDNTPFWATLTYTGWSRGRSSAVLCFKDAIDIEYTMFLSSFDKVAKLMQGGKITGRWAFVKKGMNYGVELLDGVTA